MSDKSIHDHLHLHSDPPQFEAFGVCDLTKRAFSLAMGAWILEDAHGFWLPPESRDGHCDPFYFVTRIADRISELSSAHNGDTFGSPIEAQLYATLLWIELDWAGFPKYDMIGIVDGDTSSTLDGFGRCWITPQAKIGNYTVDFLLWVEHGPRRGGIAIECDGHDFHEKTKEQAARDKKRDRDLLAAGYPVMRFTGSEIFRDPVACAGQVKEPALDILNRIVPHPGQVR